MILYKRKKIRFIVSIAVLLFLPLFGNAATTEESEEEILFITSYNSDTKYTYDNISTFIETYTQLGGRYSTMVENMNATDLTQAHQWKKTLTDILDKHPKAKLVILLGGEAWSSFLHLEDEKYKQLPVFCAMASRNGIRIPLRDAIAQKTGSCLYFSSSRWRKLLHASPPRRITNLAFGCLSRISVNVFFH